MVRPECVKHKAKGGARQPIHLYFVIITDYPHITTALPFAGEKGEDMRLIDADALEKDLARRWDATDCADFADKEVWRALREAPTIDAVPVVRCKDCKHRDPEDKKCDCGHAIQWQLPRDDDWFCADGEREDDE